MVKELKNKKDFSSAVGNEGTGLVVIDFFADWCGPCKRIAPKIDAFTEKYKNVGFYKINVENQELSKICEACQIKSLPTFCLFVGGKYITNLVGANESELEKLVVKYMEKQVPKEELLSN